MAPVTLTLSYAVHSCVMWLFCLVLYKYISQAVLLPAAMPGLRSATGKCCCSDENKWVQHLHHWFLFLSAFPPLGALSASLWLPVFHCIHKNLSYLYWYPIKLLYNIMYIYKWAYLWYENELYRIFNTAVMRLLKFDQFESKAKILMSAIKSNC